jgi:hypothetical protein
MSHDVQFVVDIISDGGRVCLLLLLIDSVTHKTRLSQHHLDELRASVSFFTIQKWYRRLLSILYHFLLTTHSLPIFLLRTSFTLLDGFNVIFDGCSSI